MPLYYIIVTRPRIPSPHFLTFHFTLIMSGGRTFTLASRPSKLAIVQTELVLTALQNQHPHIDLKTRYISSAGDKNQTDALYLMGGKSVWTEELEAALIDGSVDLVVHSLKDVPTTLPAGMEIGAILEREDPVDGLVMKDSLPFKTLGDLPDGSVIGTSSLRRVAQLRRAHPRLKYIDVVSPIHPNNTISTQAWGILSHPEGEYV